jgi:hypothetical protein
VQNAKGEKQAIEVKAPARGVDGMDHSKMH